jgi:hypothetical protein
VDYYLGRGETEKARQIADEAGEVYSYRGLETKARFLESTGDNAGAFEWFAKIEERYDDPGPVVAFCNRYTLKTGDHRFDSEMRKRVEKVFAKGQEKVALKDFSSAPTDGVLIRAENALIRESGLHQSDVIVALYGIRVHNFAQYDYLRSLDSRPELILIVWQSGRYREITASPPQHRFGVDFGDYPAK